MKLRFLLLAVLITSLVAQAQHLPAAQVPAPATTAFQRYFPAATKTRWEQQQATYVVHFAQQKLVGRAVFTATGSLLEQREEIPYSAFPALARTAMGQHFPHRQIDKIYRVTSGTGTIGYTALVCAGKNKRGKDIDCQTMLFDQNGRLLSKS